MISVDEALEKILSQINVLPGEEKPILDCVGQVLADDVYSSINIPPLDNSARDGYAVRSQDTDGASRQSPRFLRVVDTITAGSVSKHELEPGTAVRIMTGAWLPRGVDSVVALEETDEVQRPRSSAEIGILTEVKAGKNIHLTGEDIVAGSMILNRGTTIRALEVGVLASQGYSTVKVIRRPVVAVLAIGDELVNINQPLPSGKIYNSSTYTVAALVRRYGGILKLLGIASESEGSLLDRLHRGLDADMLITTGSVSMGDYDVVRDVLAKEGEIAFWKVRMKPRRPVTFGTINRLNETGVTEKIPLVGLPGKPVNTVVGFELFTRPAILKMMGKRNLAKPTVEAILEDTITNKDGRRVFARVIVKKRDGQYFAHLTDPLGSGIQASMMLANGLAVVPEDKAEVRKGNVVQVMMLDWDE